MKQFNLQEYLANPNRQVVTRDGRAVKIYCTDYIDKFGKFIIAKIEGNSYSYSFREDGRFVDYKETDNDLFFASEKHEGWIIINKYPDGERDTNGIIYDTELDIPNKPQVGTHRVATVKVEWEE